MSLESFVMMSGTVPGREHVRVLRNNQDGCELVRRPASLAAVVTDGCSSGQANEVGARFAATWLARHVGLFQAWAVDEFALMKELSDGLLLALEGLMEDLRGPDGDPAWAVSNFLLFTYQVVLVTRERTLIFGQGDGVWSLNGTWQVLEPGPGNAPRYLAYRLLPQERRSYRDVELQPKLHASVPTKEVQSLFIGSDGIAELEEQPLSLLRDGAVQGGLEQFEENKRFSKNPSLLQKRLNVLSIANGRFRDDATLALIQRR